MLKTHAMTFVISLAKISDLAISYTPTQPLFDLFNQQYQMSHDREQVEQQTILTNKASRRLVQDRTCQREAPFLHHALSAILFKTRYMRSEAEHNCPALIALVSSHISDEADCLCNHCDRSCYDYHNRHHL